MKIITLTFTLITFFSSVIASDGGISFLPEETSFQEVLDKAKAENKLIFLDAYTTWCGPCKWMDKNVFNDPEIGKYFNENFINIKFDMEKGEGIELAKKYDVKAFPTYLFLNGKGDVVHRVCGSDNKEAFLEKAKTALNEEETLGKFLAKYEQGNRDLLFLKNFLLKRSKACMNSDEVLAEYWELQKKEDWLSEFNWEIYKAFVSDYNDPKFQFLLAHIDDIKSIAVIEKEVDDHVENVISRALFRLIYKSELEKLDSLKNELEEYQLTAVEKAMAKAAIVKSSREKNWQEYFDNAVYYVENFEDGDTRFIEGIARNLYENCDDKEVLNKAIEWMEVVLQSEENQFYETNRTYAALLLKTGNIENGVKAAEKAIELAKKVNWDYSEVEDLIKKYEQ